MASDMTEAQLQSNVLEYCRLKGVLAYHPHDSRRSQPGFPDLTLVGDHGMLLVELKTATGKLSDEQVVWRNALGIAGARIMVWRPEDWPVLACREIDTLGRCTPHVAYLQAKREAEAMEQLRTRNARLDRY